MPSRIQRRGCSHKFIDSNVCLKCGVHVRELLRAEQMQAGAKGRQDRKKPGLAQSLAERRRAAE